MLLSSFASLLVTLSFAQIDEVGLLRVDPLGKNSPVGIELYSQSIGGSDALSALTKSDSKIGKLLGKKVVWTAFGFDYSGDGNDEILIATEATTDPVRPLSIKVHPAPMSPGGDLGAPIATLKTGSFALAGYGRVVAMCAIDFDQDSRDELCVVRAPMPPIFEHRLEIFDFPTGSNKKIGALLASDWTFGSLVEDVVAVSAADANYDGIDELVVLRRDSSANESIEVIAPPKFPIGESTTLTSDTTILAPDFAPIEAAVAFQRNGPLGFQIGLLRRGADGAARLDVHALAAGGGGIGAPIATEGPLDGSGVGLPIVGLLSIRHDQKLPWVDFEGPLNAHFHVAYPNANGQIVSSWIGPIAGFEGTVTATTILDIDSEASSWGPASATVANWSLGSTVTFSPWHILQLDITKSTGIASPGQWLVVTLPSATIEWANATKKRLRYTNPGGPTTGAPIGELQMFADPPSGYQGPGGGGPPTGPQLIAIASVMEFYLEKP